MINELATKYVYLGSWFNSKDGDQTITVEQFEKVLDEIGSLETKLSENGLSDEGIQKLIAISKDTNFSSKPLSQLSQQELASIHEICSNYHHSVNTT